MRYYFFAGALAFFSHLALAFHYATDPVYYHHRGLVWIVFVVLMGLSSASWATWMGGVKDFLVGGIFWGSIFAMLADEAIQGGVENYWQFDILTGVAVCLPDFLLWFSIAWMMIASGRRVRGEQKERANA